MQDMIYDTVHTVGYRSVSFISNLRVSLANGVPSGPQSSNESVSIESSKFSIKSAAERLPCFSNEISLRSLVLLSDIYSNTPRIHFTQLLLINILFFSFIAILI